MCVCVCVFAHMKSYVCVCVCIDFDVMSVLVNKICLIDPLHTFFSHDEVHTVIY